MHFLIYIMCCVHKHAEYVFGKTFLSTQKWFWYQAILHTLRSVRCALCSGKRRREGGKSRSDACNKQCCSRCTMYNVQCAMCIKYCILVFKHCIVCLLYCRKCTVCSLLWDWEGRAGVLQHATSNKQHNFTQHKTTQHNMQQAKQFYSLCWLFTLLEISYWNIVFASK